MWQYNALETQLISAEEERGWPVVNKLGESYV